MTEALIGAGLVLLLFIAVIVLLMYLDHRPYRRTRTIRVKTLPGSWKDAKLSRDEPSVRVSGGLDVPIPPADMRQLIARIRVEADRASSAVKLASDRLDPVGDEDLDIALGALGVIDALADRAWKEEPKL